MPSSTENDDITKYVIFPLHSKTHLPEYFRSQETFDAKIWYITIGRVRRLIQLQQSNVTTKLKPKEKIDHLLMKSSLLNKPKNTLVNILVTSEIACHSEN